jgi:hypothetical protein
MSGDTLEPFGRLLVTQSRDVAIRHFDLLSQGHYVAVSWKPLQDEIAALSEEQRELLRRCVVSSIECGLESFLQAIREGEVAISVAGQELAESDVNLANMMWDKGGWISRYSEYPPETS